MQAQRCNAHGSAVRDRGGPLYSRTSSGGAAPPFERRFMRMLRHGWSSSAPILVPSLRGPLELLFAIDNRPRRIREATAS